MIVTEEVWSLQKETDTYLVILGLKNIAVHYSCQEFSVILFRTAHNHCNITSSISAVLTD